MSVPATIHKDPGAFDFYPERFWYAVEGWTDAEIVRYWRLLGQQWMRDGLPDDRKAIEGLARGKITDRVFEKFPQWADGTRRNNKLEIERGKQRERIAKAKEKSRKMLEARYKQNGKQCLEHTASTATSSSQVDHKDNLPPTTHDSPQLTAIPTPRGIPVSVEQAVSMAESAGVPADYAETIFHEHEGATWEDGQGRPINSFPHYIKARYTNRTDKLAREEKRYGQRTNGAPSNGSPTANTVYQVQQQIDVINEQLRDIDSTVVGAWGELSPAKKEERRKLIERRKELKQKMAGVEARS